MNKKGIELIGLNSTGSYSHEKSTLHEKSLIQKAGPLILGLSLALGTGSTQLAKPYCQEQPNIPSSNVQLQRVLKSDVLTSLSITPHEQLNQIKRLMGLNILEIASILLVTRPTVYGWIESKKIGIRKNNQERLNSIYEISKSWKSKGLGRVENYLHKPIGVENISLFDLLKSDTLNLSKIYNYLDNIAQIMLKQRLDDKAHESALRKHGFRAISKEEMKDRLDNTDFLG